MVATALLVPRFKRLLIPGQHLLLLVTSSSQGSRSSLHLPTTSCLVSRQAPSSVQPSSAPAAHRAGLALSQLPHPELTCFTSLVYLPAQS